MDEDLQIIESFLGEYNADAGTNYQISEAAPAGANVDEQPAKDTAEKAKPKKKPALRVIEGGAKAVDATPIPMGLPEPGGIGLLLLIILFVLFAIVPTQSGATRLHLMWLSILGKAGFGDAQAQTSGSGGTKTLPQVAASDPYLTMHLGVAPAGTGY